MNTYVVNTFLHAFSAIQHTEKFPTISAEVAISAYNIAPNTEKLLFVRFSPSGLSGVIITDQSIYYNQFQTKTTWHRQKLTDIRAVIVDDDNMRIDFGNYCESFNSVLFEQNSLVDFSKALNEVVHSAKHPGNDTTMYHTVLDGKQAGPYSINQIISMAKNGQVNNETLVWTAGFESWMPAGQVIDLPSTPPPVPIPPPVPQQNTYPEVNQPLVQQQQEEEHLYIKCINCGEVYTVNKDDYSENDILYTCDKCGGDIGVRFFGYCNRCDAHVGFVDDPNESTIRSIAQGAIQGILDPTSGLRFLGALVDNIPRANTYGICPNCGEEYIECPHCREAVHVPKDAEITSETFTCPNCGTKSRHP